MPRNPGIQNKMRMEEVATALAYTAGSIQDAFRRIRECEAEVEILKGNIEEQQKRKTRLLEIQNELMEAQRITEFGLPPDLPKEDFELVTQHTITS